MKLYGLIIFALLFMTSVTAQTSLNIYLETDGSALFLGRTDSSTLALPSGVTLSDGQVRGTTHELTSKTGSLWTFSYSLSNADLAVILPEGAVIVDAPNVSAIRLEENSIVLERANSIVVHYRIESVEQSRSLEGLAFIGLALMLIAVTYWATHYYRKKNPPSKGNNISLKEKKPKADSVDMLKNILNEREHLILTTLEKTGKIKMSYLRRECAIPKASFSRHIQELVKKKLVVISGEGKNKLVEKA